MTRRLRDAPLCIDVSLWQGDIDWAAVAAGGIRYAMVKATQGTFTDPRFHANIEGAHAAGLSVGAYHYLTAGSPEAAEREARHFLAQLEGHRDRLRLWAALDVEEDSVLAGLRPAELHAVTDAFLGAVQAAGHAPLLYTNPNYIRCRYRSLPAWPLWLALWRPRENIPEGYGEIAMWQYGTDTVAGVCGRVDVNLLLGETPRTEESKGGKETMTEEKENGNIPSPWAEEAVAWAIENGILYGDGAGGYALREGCTREQVLVFLHRALRQTGGSV